MQLHKKQNEALFVLYYLLERTWHRGIDQTSKLIFFFFYNLRYRYMHFIVLFKLYYVCTNFLYLPFVKINFDNYKIQENGYLWCLPSALKYWLCQVDIWPSTKRSNQGQGKRSRSFFEFRY